MPPPASRPHRRKTRPPPTTPRASAPGVLVMWSKARRSSRDATSRQRGVHQDGHIAGPKGPDQVHHRRLLPLLPAVTPLMLPRRCCPPPPPRSESAASFSIPANQGDPATLPVAAEGGGCPERFSVAKRRYHGFTVAHARPGGAERPSLHVPLLARGGHRARNGASETWKKLSR
jgi:hypothetical protein